MAPQGAICSLVCAARSERRVGIEVGWDAIGDELIAPGALDFGAVDKPELLAQQLEALEDCECLLGRPMRGPARTQRSVGRRGCAAAAISSGGPQHGASRTRLAC